MTTVPRQVLGTWVLTIATPIGKMAVLVNLSDQDGQLTGTAQDRNAVVPLHDITTAPDTQATSTHITWRQSITKPMRLKLQFDVIAIGETMTGFAKAGRLPRSEVHGERRPDS